MALLKGEVLSIMTGYSKFNCTNLPREISRGIEQKFGVQVSREKIQFKSKFDDKPGFYYRYRLNKTEYNEPGILLIEKYISENGGSIHSKKESTTKEIQPIHQQNSLF